MSPNIQSPYLFVSYSSLDRSRVIEVIDDLQSSGMRFWIDKNQIPGGADYTQVIPKAISESSGIVVFLSSNAFASQHVKKELNIGLRKKKPTIPLMLENIVVPDEFVYNLEGVQQISLFDQEEAKWKKKIEQAMRSHKVDFTRKKVEPSALSQYSRINSYDDVGLSVSPIVPFLVDRIQQERALQASLSDHYKQNKRGPIFVFGIWSERTGHS